jgi:predicted AlkP superfamily pyrophosphatase or phosphodiesterase
VSSRARLAKSPPRVNGGEHGYDNDLPSMQALFVAAGPSFRRGITVPSLDIIHLYPLMAQILGLRPAKTDGSLDSVRALLRP